MPKVLFELDANTTKAEKAIRNFGTLTNKTMGGISSSLNQVKLLGAGLVGAFAGRAVISQLSEFSKSIAEISTVAGDAGKDTLALSKKMISVAATFGKSATEEAQTYYQIISAGITDVAKANETLIASNKLAIGGLASTTEAVDIITTAMNVYKTSNLSASNAADILFTAVKLGKTNVSQLASSLGKLLPNSNALGVSFAESAGAVAALTAGGIKTAEATTALNAVFSGLLGAQSKVKGESKEIKEAFSLQALSTKGLTKFLKDMYDSVDGDSVKLKELLGSTQAVTAINALAGDSFKTLGDDIDQMGDKAKGAADEALGKIKNAFGTQLDDVFKNVKNLALRFSIEGADVGVSILKDINKWLIDTIKNVPKAVNAIGRFAAVFKNVDWKQVAKSITTLAVAMFASNGLVTLMKTNIKTIALNALAFGKFAVSVLIAATAIDLFVSNFDKIGQSLKIAKLNQELGELEKRLAGLRRGEQVNSKLLFGKDLDLKGDYTDYFTVEARIGENLKKQTELINAYDDKNWSSGILGEVAKVADGFNKQMAKGFDFSLGGLDNLETEVKNTAKGLSTEGIDIKINTGIMGFVDSIKEGWDISAKYISDSWDSISNSFGSFFGKKEETPTELGPDGKPVVATKEVEETNYLADAMNALTSVFNGSFLNGTADIVKSIGDMPTALSDGFKNLIGAMNRVIKDFPKIVEKFLKQLPTFIKQIIAMIPRLFATLAKSLPKLLIQVAKAIPKIITQIVKELPAFIDEMLKALPDIIDGILEGLPDLILAIAEAIPQIIKSIAEAIPKIVVVLAKNMGPIISALVKGLASAIPEIIAVLINELVVEGGALKIAIALINAMVELIPAVATGLWEGLKEGFTNFKFSKPLWAEKLKISGFTKMSTKEFGNLFSSFGPALEKTISGIGDPTRTWGRDLGELLNKAITPPQWVADFLASFDRIISQFTTIPEWMSNLSFSIDKLFTPPQWLAQLQIQTPPWLESLKEILSSFSFSFSANLYEWRDKFRETLNVFGGKIQFVFNSFKERITYLWNWLSARLATLFNFLAEVFAGSGGVDSWQGGAWKDRLTPRGATGGMVPSGFNNDTYPALLTSGEQIFDSGLSAKLSDYLNGQQSGKPTVVQLMLDGDKLAEVILNLNRNNNRLYA